MKKFLWIVAGIVENESLIGLSRQLAKQIPEHEHWLVSNCLNLSIFPGKTYCTPNADTLDENYRTAIISAYEEGLIQKADVVVTGSWYAAHLIYLLTVRGKRLADVPIVYLIPKANEGQRDIADQWGDEENFWRLVGRERNTWAVCLDNDREQELIHAKVDAACPSNKKLCTLRLVSYRYEGMKDAGVAKEKAFAWSGRFNTVQNPREASTVAGLVNSIHRIKSRAFLLSTTASGGGIEHMRKGFTEVNVGLNTKQYIAGMRSAKVALITSVKDAFPFGKIEMLEHGLIPVFSAKPWNETFVGPGWPLRYTKLAEAIEMIHDACERYEHYRALLHDAMQKRYDTSPNFRGLIHTILEQERVTNARREFSSGFAGGRIG